MLKKITLTNFKTFIKSTDIDFSATNYKFLEEDNVGSNRILKGALFVGENASGKTQILKSITFLLDLLFGNSDVDFLLNKSFYTNKETYKIKYYFVIDEKNIDYELEIGIDKIVKEKLECDNKIIIDRLGNTAQFNYNESKTYNDLTNKLLFLRRIFFDTHFYDDKILNDWFLFLKNSVYVNCYDRNVVTYNNDNLLAHEYLNESGTDEINNFLKKINYNQNIVYDTETPNKNGIFNMKSNDNKKFISFMKEGTDVYIPETFESTGNITLVQLLPAFIHSINTNSMLIIDEFSSGFHNELEECFIKYFNHYSKDSQLIFTSHSTNILNNTIIRPDQIYSVCFKPTKGSVVKRFSDEMPREAQNTEKMYLNGVFDGMPRYNKIFKD